MSSVRVMSEKVEDETAMTRDGGGEREPRGHRCEIAHAVCAMQQLLVHPQALRGRALCQHEPPTMHADLALQTGCDQRPYLRDLTSEMM